MKKDFANSSPAPHDLMQERIWKRLERSTARPGRRWYAGAGMVVASVLLALGVVHFMTNSEMTPMVTSKSGGESGQAQLLVVPSDNPQKLRLELKASDKHAYYAVIEANKSRDVLWQGQAAEWPREFVQPHGEPRQLCLVTAESPNDLQTRLNILRTYSDVSQDLTCIEVH